MDVVRLLIPLMFLLSAICAFLVHRCFRLMDENAELRKKVRVRENMIEGKNEELHNIKSSLRVHVIEFNDMRFQEAGIITKYRIVNN